VRAPRRKGVGSEEAHNARLARSAGLSARYRPL